MEINMALSKRILYCNTPDTYFVSFFWIDTEIHSPSFKHYKNVVTKLLKYVHRSSDAYLPKCGVWVVVFVAFHAVFSFIHVYSSIFIQFSTVCFKFCLSFLENSLFWHGILSVMRLFFFISHVGQFQLADHCVVTGSSCSFSHCVVEIWQI